MDVIILESPGEILYRPHGEHGHSPGTGSVVGVYPMCAPTVVRAPRPPTDTNLAGYFVSALQPGTNSGVSVKTWQPFGDHLELYHLEGSVTVYDHCVHFKGCRGARSAAVLASDLCLDSPSCVVHMGVFGASIGRKLHTGLGCFLENRLAHRFRSLRVCNRIFDMSTVVKLRIDRFDSAEMPHLDGSCAPMCVDILISGNGAINVRMSWARCAWDQAVEDRVLAFCGWVAGIVRECS